MVDRIAGENDDRLLGGETSRQQRRSDMPGGGQQLRVADLPPAAARITLRHEHTVRLRLTPMVQAFGESGGKFAERDFRTQIDSALPAAPNRDRRGGGTN